MQGALCIRALDLGFVLHNSGEVPVAQNSCRRRGRFDGGISEHVDDRIATELGRAFPQHFERRRIIARPCVVCEFGDTGIGVSRFGGFTNLIVVLPVFDDLVWSVDSRRRSRFPPQRALSSLHTLAS